MFQIIKVNFHSKGRFSKVTNLFPVIELPTLFEEGTTIAGGSQGINSTWCVRAVANGDGSVTLKRYSRDIKYNGQMIEIEEDDKRNITHILIPIYSVIRDQENNEEYPYLAEAQCVVKMPVSNVGNIFSFK